MSRLFNLQLFGYTGGNVMKPSIRTKLLGIPVVGYGLRVVANIAKLPRNNDRLRVHLDEQQQTLSILIAEQQELRSRLNEAEQILGTKEERVEAIERRLRLMDGRIHNMQQTATPAKKAAPAADTQPATAHANSGLLADNHDLDQFYIEFENKFRGSEESIKERLEIYLPYFKKQGKKPVVDIGCGRGELLQLLKEHRIPAKGIDLNENMVQRAQEQGLDALQADAMKFLADQPVDSLAAVTGFHIVEHIPFAALVELMDACYRAITPGGYAIFETPNPENLIVGSVNFYHDPSHLNPIPPALLKFVMETRGFTNVEIKRLHPMETKFESEDPLVNRMAERMFGPCDYAVVAQK